MQNTLSIKYVLLFFHILGFHYLLEKVYRTSSKYTTKLEDFGSYFITLMCSWIYENDKIILEYPPTHQGLLDWIIQKNVANLDEREQIVNSFPHKKQLCYKMYGIHIFQ